MAVFRWGTPWFAFQELEQQVDRLLRSVTPFQGLGFGRQFPALNLHESEEEFLLTAELPGVAPDEVELSLAGGLLTLSGQRTGPPDVAEGQFRRAERFRGAWQRSVSLPDRVDTERLRAEFRHGVLVVHLPKAAVSQPRQIPVTEEDD